MPKVTTKQEHDEEVEEVAEIFAQFGVLLVDTVRWSARTGAIHQSVAKEWREFGRRLAQYAKDTT